MKSYCNYICPFCNKKISANGAARASHGRKHVREGIAIEINHLHRDYRGQIEFIRLDTHHRTEK